MRQAITTKHLPATNTKPARVKATTASGISLTKSYPIDGDHEYGHKNAALALCQKLGWTGEIVGGATRDGYVFVFVN